MLMAKAIDFRPIILAGGSGTRFWPRSRKARAKQVLALDGDRSMIQQTVERLRPLAEVADIWVITNDLMSDTISQQLVGVPSEQVICEPAPRNTAPAAALAAFLIEKQNPDAVLGVFPFRSCDRGRATVSEDNRKGNCAGGRRGQHGCHRDFSYAS